MKLSAIARDFNAPAFWAGLTAFVWYAFGAVPLHIAVAGQLGLTADQSSSWIFVIWTSGAAASIEPTNLNSAPRTSNGSITIR